MSRFWSIEVQKGNLAIFEGSNISETKWPHPPKLFCMYVISIPGGINFLSPLWSITFFGDHGLYPMVQKGNLAIFEGSNISKTKEATPTKIVLHVCDINPYLHIIFEPITIDYIFWWPWTIHGPKAIFEGSNISETEEAMPIKIVLHACDTNPYLHEFLSWFQLIRFFDNSPKVNLSHFWRQKKEQNLQNWRAKPTKIGLHVFTSTSTCMILWANFIFWSPWTIVHDPKGKLSQIWEGAKSSKPKKPHTLTLVTQIL